MAQAPEMSISWQESLSPAQGPGAVTGSPPFVQQCGMSLQNRLLQCPKRREPRILENMGDANKHLLDCL